MKTDHRPKEWWIKGHGGCIKIENMMRNLAFNGVEMGVKPPDDAGFLGLQKRG
jgi:hypothetical protein